MSFFIELFPRIGKVQISYKDLNFKSGKRKIIFIQSDSFYYQVNLPVILKECKGNNNSATGFFDISLIKHITLKNSDPALNFTCFSMHCGKCSNSLVNNFQFEKVFPLPSENWRALSDLWFCHNKESNETLNKFFQDEIFAPLHSLLVDDLNFLLHQDDLLSGSIFISKSSELDSLDEVCCSKCTATLGTVNIHSKTVNLFRWCIAWCEGRRHVVSEQTSNIG
jgi:hypothetical protein